MEQSKAKGQSAENWRDGFAHEVEDRRRAARERISEQRKRLQEFDSQLTAKLDEAFKPPFSPNHPLGTDNFGRDMWSRILYGGRLDIQIGLISVVFPFVFGTFVGAWVLLLFGLKSSSRPRMVQKTK